MHRLNTILKNGSNTSWRIRCLVLMALCSAIGCRPNNERTVKLDNRMSTFDLQGHRGARGLLPENTIQAFEKALEIGVNTLELDVLVSADEQVVVSHDPTFSPDICSHPDGRAVAEEERDELRLFDMPYEEIRLFDCGSRGNERFPEQQPIQAHKPLLSEVLDLGERYAREHDRQAVAYNIEIKSRPGYDGILHPSPVRFVELVLAVVRRAEAGNRTTIQSFDPRILQALHEQAPELTSALLVDRGADQGVAGNLELLGFVPHVYSPHHLLVDAGLVEDCRRFDMKLVPWTVNEKDEMERLIRLGVDGLITDYPDVAAEYLRSTGWPGPLNSAQPELP